MPQRSLTALLKAHHDKLDQHTQELVDIEAKMASLEAAVADLEKKAATDPESGARAGLRDWLNSIRELI